MKLIVLSLLITVASYAEAAKAVVCCIPTWGPDFTSKVNPSYCSIYIIAFGTLDGNGNIGLKDNFSNFKTLKTANSKLVLSLGGTSFGKCFSKVAATKDRRLSFANNAKIFLEKIGLDGVDIGWEYPEASDAYTFVPLLFDLKASLGSKYIVSTTVSVGQWLASTNNDIAQLGRAVDYINLMTYDMHMDEGINLFLQGGAPASKLIVGVPFYGRQYQLANSSSVSPGSQFIGGRQASDVNNTPAYNSYCSKLSNGTWTKQRDATAKAPYMYSGNVWISYEDQTSITDKANLANKYKLGGVMAWALHQDDYDGICSSCKWPLLNALSVAVGRIPSSSACKTILRALH